MKPGIPDTAADLPAPIEPMLAKAIDALPSRGGFLFEPKWDGFRAIVFRPPPVTSRSRAATCVRSTATSRSCTRRCLDALPPSCVVDGEIVIVTPRGLDFDALQLRLHPAASRAARLARETPAAFVAFDLLAADGRDLMRRARPSAAPRSRALLATARPPLYLTPATRDRALAAEWLRASKAQASTASSPSRSTRRYRPGQRTMLKIKHVRTADCVVAGFRWHKSTLEGGPARSARCCSASTTTPACCITSA